MRHIAPIVNCIIGIVGRRVCIAEDESEDVSAIDDSIEVIDLRLIRWVPRAVEAWVVLLHTWQLGEWPKEGKVSHVDCGPEKNEKQKCSGLCRGPGPGHVGENQACLDRASSRGGSQ